MRAFSRVGGKVRITLPDEYDTERGSVVVERAEYNELRDQILDGDSVRAEMKRSLDAALSQIERLSDDRDHWQQEAENQQKDAELWKSLAQRQDNTAPLHLKIRELERVRDDLARRVESAEAALAKYPLPLVWHTTHDHVSAVERADVDELRATVVRQANEITRLTGESE